MRLVLLCLALGLTGCAHVSAAQWTKMEREAAVIEAVLEAGLAENRRDWDAAVKRWERAVALDPESPELRERFARSLWRSGRPEASLREVRKARRDLGDHPDLLAIHGRLSAYFGDAGQAYSLMRRAWEADNSLLSVAAGLSRMETERGRFEEAVKLVDAVLAKDPLNQDMRLRRLELLKRIGRDEELLSEYEILVREGPENRKLVREYVAKARSLGRLEQAREALESAVVGAWSADAALVLTDLAVEDADYHQAEHWLSTLESFGESHRQGARERRIELALSAGEGEQALRLVDQAEAEGWDPDELRVWRARGLDLLGRVDEALAVLDAGGEGFRDDGLALLESNRRWEEILERVGGERLRHPEHRRRAVLAALESGDTEAAARLLEPISELEPAFYYFAQSHILATSGDVNAALLLLTVGVMELPDHAAPRRAMVSVLVDDGRLDEAVDVLKQARKDGVWTTVYEPYLMRRVGKAEESEALALELLAAAPDDPQLLNFIGYNWADEGRRLDEAEDFIRRAVAADPWNGAYLDSLGWVLHRRGRSADALRYLERAALLEPDEAEIAEHLGDVYRATGNEERAETWYRRGLEQAEATGGESERVARLKEKLGLP